MFILEVKYSIESKILIFYLCKVNCSELTLYSKSGKKYHYINKNLQKKYSIVIVWVLLEYLLNYCLRRTKNIWSQENGLCPTISSFSLLGIYNFGWIEESYYRVIIPFTRTPLLAEVLYPTIIVLDHWIRKAVICEL